MKQTTEVVAIMPPALTLRAASLVPVKQDSLEMDSPAQVNTHLLYCRKTHRPTLCHQAQGCRKPRILKGLNFFRV